MPQRTILMIHADEIGWSDVRLLLRTMNEVVVIGNATTAPDAMQIAGERQPDILLLGATIDDVSAAPLLADLRRSTCSGSLAAVFTADFDVAEYELFAHLGISGYFIWRDITLATLRSCLAALITGTVLIGTRTLAPVFLGHNLESPSASGPTISCSPRERQVLQELACGNTRREIASRLRLSQRTVDRIIGRLEMKLDAHDLFVLGMRSALLGIVP